MKARGSWIRAWLWLVQGSRTGVSFWLAAVMGGWMDFFWT